MWVYECDSTLELDTQIMRKCNILKFKKPYIDYELLDFSRESITQKTVYSTSYATTNIPYDEDFPNERQYNHIVGSSQGPGVDARFFYPFNLNSSSFGSSRTYYRGYQDSIEVLGA